MALPTAQLGQLPSMNLATHAPVQIVQPVWKQALAAFLTNTAGGIAKEGVSNAFATDYAKAASAEGLPGATSPDTGNQGFWSKVLHGPEWDKTRFQTGVQSAKDDARLQAERGKWNQQLGLSEQEMRALQDYREKDLAIRQAEQGSRESERKDNANFRQLHESNQVQDRWEAMLARTQEADAKRSGPLARAQLRKTEADARLAEMLLDPKYRKELAAAGAVGAVQERNAGKEAIMERLFPTQGGAAPTNNSDTYNPRGTGQQTTPGSSPVRGVPQEYLPGKGIKTTAYPQPDVTQSVTGGAGSNPSAGVAGQFGQMADMSATPPPVQDFGEAQPVTQEQPLMQHVGADLMSLVGPPQTPNSPTAIQSSSPVNNPSPTPTNTDTYRLAQILARKFGTAPGMGGTPMTGGSGGLPLGYG